MAGRTLSDVSGNILPHSGPEPLDGETEVSFKVAGVAFVGGVMVELEDLTC